MLRIQKNKSEISIFINHWLRVNNNSWLLFHDFLKSIQLIDFFLIVHLQAFKILFLYS